MLLRNTRPEPESTEEGYLLLAVLVMLFLLLLALSVAAPQVAKQIQRDKEHEAMERGLQYKRAIRLYYKKFGAYPTDIKQLEKTNEIRFLRKRYTDPITGKDDWRLIHMGEAKVPPMGFFGQPLQQGMSSVTTGLGGGTGASNAGGDPGTSGTPVNGTPGSVTPNSGSSGFGFSNNNGSSGGGLGNSNPGSSGFGFSNSNTNTGSGGGFGPNPTVPGAPGTGVNTPGANNSNNAFGGGPIVGVGIPVKKPSLLEYHKQKKYSDWEFVYDPQEDLVMAGGVTGGGDTNGNPGGLGPNGTGSSGGPTGPGDSVGSRGFGFGNGGSGGGSSGGSGSSGFGFGNSGANPSPAPPSTPQPSNPQQ